MASTPPPERAPLAGVEFVAPADFVNGDDHANDDHGHGTHIASLVASRGELDGVASGVAVMPVKVLDENNAGTELALVKGIRHAVDNGAHVINMSLSFPLGYVPSPALVEAIEYAHLAGVVMVAASGNVGADVATWPAASRLVIGVGALAPGLTGSDDDDDD
ncbi:MAG: S8 family serine peptidase, partial [Myxococcota bacterium]